MKIKKSRIKQIIKEELQFREAHSDDEDESKVDQLGDDIFEMLETFKQEIYQDAIKNGKSEEEAKELARREALSMIEMVHNILSKE